MVFVIIQNSCLNLIYNTYKKYKVSCYVSLLCQSYLQFLNLPEKLMWEISWLHFLDFSMAGDDNYR